MSVVGGRIDRDAVLAAVDLEELADRLVGLCKQTGSAKKWPSPVRGHEQTGRTPPMGIFVGRSGVQRWTCFATGRSGTAIDLVMEVNGWDFKEALYWLADGAGMEIDRPAAPARPQRAPRAPLSDVQRLEGLTAMCEWHDLCVEWLRKPAGAMGRRWLDERCYGWEDLDALAGGIRPRISDAASSDGAAARGAGGGVPRVRLGGERGVRSVPRLELASGRQILQSSRGAQQGSAGCCGQSRSRLVTRGARRRGRPSAGL